MKLLNVLSDNLHFQKTSLYKTFKERPLSFIDAGAAGGVYPLIMPVASLVHCTCFEPDPGAHEKLLQHYKKNEVFAKFVLFDTALGKEDTDAILYLTASPVNSSLLKPRRMLIDRYGIKGVNLEREVSVRTEPLDMVVFKNDESRESQGEFIKLDCQGAEYEILQGATRTLDEHCMALICEVAFLPSYKNHKTFSEVDILLRGKGFVLYGLYPKYVSAKKLNRRKFDTEERIAYADALYFKDPLDAENRGRKYGKRAIQVLLITAILTKYYDFALEILNAYGFIKEDQERIGRLILSLAERDKNNLEGDLFMFINEVEKRREDCFILAKKFIDRHKSNNDVDLVIL